jgi:hypothetical protein
LEFNKEKGIAGNNRTGSATNYYFDKIIMDGDILLGLGIEIVNKINGGSSEKNGNDMNI